MTWTTSRSYGGNANIADNKDLEEWIPVTLTSGSAPVTLPVATPCKGSGAGTLSRLVCADAWWRDPIGQIHRGDLIEIFPITSALDSQVTRTDG